MVCENEDKNDDKDDEKGEKEKDNKGEGANEFGVGGVRSDDHERGEVGLEKEWGVHCRWKRIDNE